MNRFKRSIIFSLALLLGLYMPVSPTIPVQMMPTVHGVREVIARYAASCIYKVPANSTSVDGLNFVSQCLRDKSQWLQATQG